MQKNWEQQAAESVGEAERQLRRDQARAARLEQADRDLASLAEETRKLQRSRETGALKALADFVARPLPRCSHVRRR